MVDVGVVTCSHVFWGNIHGLLGTGEDGSTTRVHGPVEVGGGLIILRQTRQRGLEVVECRRDCGRRERWDPWSQYDFPACLDVSIVRDAISWRYL